MNEPDAELGQSLSKPLVIALVTPVVLLIVVGALLYGQVRSLTEAGRWVEHSSDVLALANRAFRQIIDQETGLRGYLMTKERAFLQPYETAAPAPLLARLVAVTADDPRQQGRAFEVQRRYEVWLDDARKAVSSATPEKHATTEALLERKRSMDAIRTGLDRFVEAEEELQVQRRRAAIASEEESERMLIGTLLVVALVLVIVSRTQLSRVAGSFRHALDGARLARDRALASEQLRAAQLDVASSLQGDLAVSEVAQRALKVLVARSGAAVGALYVRNANKLELSSAEGLPGARRNFGLDEGLPGRAATTLTLVHTQGLNVGHLQVASASGSSDSVEVIALPVIYNQAASAVVELGFTTKVSEHTIAVIKQAAEPLSIGLASAQHGERMRQLLEETQRQTEELQLQQEELQSSNEELEAQTQSLMVAQSQLEQQQVTLEERNANLSQQREELMTTQQELSAQAEELARASRYKSEFLANMSHELRTPLNSALILARLLADNAPGTLNTEQVRYAETIYAAGNDLLTLISDILDIAKVEAGQLSVRPAPVAPQAVVEALSRIFVPLAREKRLGLEINVASDVPRTFVTDRERTEQILRNLLSNAVKFTDSGGVRLDVTRTGDHVVFSVQDTGIGIDSNQHQLIFEPFRQAETGDNRRFGGTGLGLSISRDLARLLGGDLEMESRPGAGSTFRLRLPIAGETAPAPLPAPRPAPTFTAPQPLAAAGGTHPRTLLIIDDDSGFADVVSQLAREQGFEPLVASEADEGFALARSARPAAITLDIGLPDHSGLTVLDRLKRDPELRHIPVHIISAADFARAAREMGAAGYLLKPVAREQLQTVMREVESMLARTLRRLLIVEDDAVQRESMAKLLEADGVQIETVSTAQEATARLRDELWDCVVLDLSLPDASGFQVLEDLASHRPDGMPPVIVYTGRVLSNDEELKLRRYSASVIVKGARSPERLLDEVGLFLHQVESRLPPDRQRMLKAARSRDEVLDGRRILLVEDDVRNIYALSSVLENLGATIEIARNGREAVERIERAADVDLVLMDIMMPEMDGLEATRRIRAHRELARLPIIALTARAMRDDQARCLEAGASDYVSKPIDVQKLLSVVRVWMPK